MRAQLNGCLQKAMGDTPCKLVYHIKIATASSIELAGKRACESRSCTNFAYLVVIVFALACMRRDVSLCLLGFALALFRYVALKEAWNYYKKKSMHRTALTYATSRKSNGLSCVRIEVKRSRSAEKRLRKM